MSPVESTLLEQAPRLLEHFTIAVGAISGVLAARGKQIDLFGVLVLALVTALGGGTVRDLLLGDLPVSWVRDPQSVATAVLAGAGTFFAVRSFEFPRQILLVADAFGLALFTVIGARKALGLGAAPGIAVVMGLFTGIAGGILRDVLTGEIPLVFRREINLYATASLFGGTAFVCTSGLFHAPRASVFIGVTVTLLLRLAAIRWKLGLPLFEPKARPSPTARD
jgi:uncharacterized membrane protein YeiH